MLNSSLEGGKEAHTVLAENPKTSRGFKMYSQLPDYDDFQGRDLGFDGV